VVGCGAWGKNHVRNYAELGALEALVDRNAETVAALQAQHGGRALSLDEVLADPGIDAVAFAMPPAQHHLLGKRALEAGKHVFLEKPMSLAAAQGQELVELAEARGLTLMVGHILQYHAVFSALRDLVRGGRLGRLRHVTSRRLAFGRIRRPEDVLWELAPHDFSMILGLTGTEPEAVDSVGAYHLSESIADLASVHLAFPGNVTADVQVSWIHPVKEHRLVVIGTEAMAVFDDGEPWVRKLMLYPHRIDASGEVPLLTPAQGDAVAVERTEPLKEELRHFLACVREGRQPLTDGREGLAVLRVLEQASAAMRAKRPS
jgi:predicted dehydrogenase